MQQKQLRASLSLGPALTQNACSLAVQHRGLHSIPSPVAADCQQDYVSSGGIEAAKIRERRVKTSSNKSSCTSSSNQTRKQEVVVEVVGSEGDTRECDKKSAAVQTLFDLMQQHQVANKNNNSNNNCHDNDTSSISDASRGLVLTAKGIGHGVAWLPKFGIKCFVVDGFLSRGAFVRVKVQSVDVRTGRVYVSVLQPTAALITAAPAESGDDTRE